MKRNERQIGIGYLRVLVLALILLSMSICSYSQAPLVQVWSITECEDNRLGYVAFTVISQSPDYDYSWQPPFEFELKAMNSGEIRSGLYDFDPSVIRINSLSAGTYQFTIYFDDECMYREEIEVKFSPRITMDAPYRRQLPSSCTANDGSMSWFKYGEPRGGIPPYNTFWLNEQGDILAEDLDYYQLPNVGSGTYTFLIVDDEGCRVSYDYELLSRYDIETEYELEHACNGQATGAIFLAFGPHRGGANVGPVRYDLDWSHGVQQRGLRHGVYMTDLSPGQYSVTITDDTRPDCNKVETFNILDNLLTPFNATIDLLVVPCENKYFTGLAKITLSGGIPPFEILINDQHWRTTEERDIIHNYLQSGEQCFTIIDQCGTVFNDCVSLEPLSITSNTISGCSGEGSINAIAIGGVPPYRYAWSSGETVSNITNKSNGIYEVTVTDASHCSVTHTVELQNSTYNTELTKAPCSHLNDGELKLTIYNPNLEPIVVISNGADVSPDQLHHVQEVVFANLADNDHIDLKIIIGPCTYTSIIQIESEPLRYELQRIDEFECVYDVYCRDDLITEGEVRGKPRFSYFEGRGGGFSSCKVPFYCDASYTNEPGWKRLRKESDKVLTYKEILEYAIYTNDVYNQHDVDVAMRNINSSGAKECHRVRYCPANLAITSLFTFLNGSPKGISFDNSCIHVDCKGLRKDFSFCIPSSLPDALQGNVQHDFIGECQSIEIGNIGVMRDMMNRIEDNHSEFRGSQTWNLINQFGSDIDAYCNHVVFCLPSFNTITTDLHRDWIRCGESAAGNNILCQPKEWGSHTSVICLERTGSCGNCYKQHDFFLSTQYERWTRNTSNLAHYYTNHEKSTFINWVDIFGEGMQYRKPIVTTNSGNKYHDWLFTNHSTILRDAPNVCGGIEDWDNDHFLYYPCNSIDKKINLVLEKKTEDQSYSFSTNDSVKIITVKMHDQKYRVLMYVRGEIYLKEELLINSKTPQLVEFRFDARDRETYSLKKITSFNTVDNEQQLKLNFANNTYLFDLPAGGSTVQAGNTTHYIPSQHRPILRTDANGNTELLSHYHCSSGMHSEDQVTLAGDAGHAILFRGAGEVRIKDDLIHSSHTQEVVIAYLDKNGHYIQKQAFDGASITNDPIKISPSLNGLDLGFTINKSMNLLGRTIQNKGGKDIVLASLSKSGQVQEINVFGTQRDEELLKLERIDDRVFFSGSTARSTGTINMGEVDILPANGQQFTFTSFVQRSGQASSRNTNLDLFYSDTLSESNSSLIISPNPADDAVNIILANAPQNASLDKLFIYSMTGKLCFESNSTMDAGLTHRLDINSWLAGGYIVVGITNTGLTLYKRFIKL